MAIIHVIIPVHTEYIPVHTGMYHFQYYVPVCTWYRPVHTCPGMYQKPWFRTTGHDSRWYSTYQSYWTYVRTPHLADELCESTSSNHTVTSLRFTEPASEFTEFERYISKPGYYYDTIMTLWINYIHYDTIMTLLLHLSRLQKSDYLTHYDKIQENTIITLMTSLLWPLWHFEYIMTLMCIITLLYPLLHFELL